MRWIQGGKSVSGQVMNSRCLTVAIGAPCYLSVISIVECAPTADVLTPLFSELRSAEQIVESFKKAKSFFRKASDEQLNALEKLGWEFDDNATGGKLKRRQATADGELEAILEFDLRKENHHWLLSEVAIEFDGENANGFRDLVKKVEATSFGSIFALGLRDLRVPKVRGKFRVRVALDQASIMGTGVMAHFWKLRIENSVASGQDFVELIAFCGTLPFEEGLLPRKSFPSGQVIAVPPVDWPDGEKTHGSPFIRVYSPGW